MLDISNYLYPPQPHEFLGDSVLYLRVKQQAFNYSIADTVSWGEPHFVARSSNPWTPRCLKIARTMAIWKDGSAWTLVGVITVVIFWALLGNSGKIRRDGRRLRYFFFEREPRGQETEALQERLTRDVENLPIPFRWWATVFCSCSPARNCSHGLSNVNAKQGMRRWKYPCRPCPLG